MPIPKTGHEPVSDNPTLPTVTLRPVERRRLARDVATATAVHVAPTPHGTLGRGLARAIGSLPQLASRRVSAEQIARRLRTLDAQLSAGGQRLLATTLEREDAPSIHAVVVAVAPAHVERRDVVIDL